MTDLAVLLPVIAGVTVGLSGAVFGVACSRPFRSGARPKWTRKLLLGSAALGVLAFVAGVAALVWGPPLAPLAAVVGGPTVAALGVSFAGRHRMA